jgi:alkanesulfonate monooxygenase SsuD/methylene tetrahydromethanopterin reductase-like flavin-dependent oxidoreductase (luciferase family)
MFETYQSWGLPVDFGQVLRDWDLLDGLVIAGDPAHCREMVERYAALGTTDLMLQFAMPTVEPAVAAESQARFMAEVVAAAGSVR